MTIGGKNTPTIGKRKNFEKFLKLVNTKDIGPGKLLHYKMIK
jgi:hypothetical protein